MNKYKNIIKYVMVIIVVAAKQLVFGSLTLTKALNIAKGIMASNNFLHISMLVAALSIAVSIGIASIFKAVDDFDKDVEIEIH